MRKSTLLLTLVVLALALVAGRVMADPAYVNMTFTDLNPQTTEHIDGDPYKGYAYITLFNNTDEYWTNLELSIFSVHIPNDGMSNISQTIFVDYAPYQPTSSQSGLTWLIDNDPLGAQMALYFGSDPVAPGHQATFTVYTDNTAFKQRFGLSIYPTIPEPSSLMALAGGLFGLLGLRFRKRA
jgi:hypothetical protein